MLRGASAAALLGAAALALTGCTAAASVDDTTWGEINSQGKPFMTFTADGGAFGNDGCNVVNGTWKEDKGTVTFGPLASTMMFCEGVDTWLSNATGATVKGNTITFVGEDGKEIGSLEKATFNAPK